MLPDMFSGGLSAHDEAAAALHLATCNECRITVSDLEQVGTLGELHGKLELPLEAKKWIRGLLTDS
jgi:hypothetical protein